MGQVFNVSCKVDIFWVSFLNCANTNTRNSTCQKAPSFIQVHRYMVSGMTLLPKTSSNYSAQHMLKNMAHACEMTVDHDSLAYKPSWVRKQHVELLVGLAEPHYGVSQRDPHVLRCHQQKDRSPIHTDR